MSSPNLLLCDNRKDNGDNLCALNDSRGITRWEMLVVDDKVSLKNSGTDGFLYVTATGVVSIHSNEATMFTFEDSDPDDGAFAITFSHEVDPKKYVLCAEILKGESTKSAKSTKSGKENLTVKEFTDFDSLEMECQIYGEATS